MKKLTCLLLGLVTTTGVLAGNCNMPLENHTGDPLLVGFERQVGNIWVYNDTYPQGIKNPDPMVMAIRQNFKLKATTTQNLTSGMITAEDMSHPMEYCRVFYRSTPVGYGYLYTDPFDCNIHSSTIVPITPPCSGRIEIGSVDKAKSA